MKTTLFIYALSLSIAIFAYGEVYSYDDDTDLDFVWTPATGNPDHYNVYLSVDGGDYTLVGTTRETSYRVSGEDGHVYRLKVQAADSNGNVGPMSDESDPVLVALPVQITLSKGYNLIGVPFNTANPITSHWLIREKGIKIVSVWDSERGTWISTFAAGNDIIGSDFPITPAMGVVVKVDSDITLTFSGTPPSISGIQLHRGYNLISLPKGRMNALTSHSFLNSSGAALIGYWDPIRGTWISAFKAGSDIIGPDFPLQPGYGYLVKVENDVTWAPSAPPLKIRRVYVPQPKLVSGFELKSLPHPIYGRAYLPDGRTPAYGAKAIISLLRNGAEIGKVEAKVDDSGLWFADLPAQYREGDVIRVRIERPDCRGEYPEIHVTGIGVQNLGTIRLSNLIPKESRLLANYPNPFNPETWIPFQLSKEANVTIRIYDMAGRLIRTLDLGILRPGFYLDRSRAVHWDGRNELGEKVASGVYFYTIQAGNFRASRRMVVVK